MTKVSELTGTELDYWVAKAERIDSPRMEIDKGEEGQIVIHYKEHSYDFEPHAEWNIAGPIIEREKINLINAQDALGKEYFVAQILDYSDETLEAPRIAQSYISVNNLLEAAMRCYVASKFGDEVDTET